MKRAIVIALAAGALCVVVGLVLGRHELLERYYVFQISRDESRFDELLRDGGDIRRRALKRYLRTEKGRKFLARRCEEVLRLLPEHARQQSVPDDWLRGASRGMFAIVVDSVYRTSTWPPGGSYYFRVPVSHGEDFNKPVAFLSLLDGFIGQRIDLPGYPGLTVQILPSKEALPRCGYYPYVDAGMIRTITTVDDPDDGPPADFTDEHRKALGDHPALFYSRE